MLIAALTLMLAAGDKPDGPALYKQHCARCHGAEGQGAKKYAKPLAGDLAVPQLAEYLDKTMPEDDPDALDADQSRAVAEYIFGTFYGKTARDRRTPVRADLSRLTVRQYDAAVADLVGSFRGEATYDFRPEGARAEPVRYARKDFVGSVFAPATGEYEFAFTLPADVRGRVWLNDFNKPLVDAWVRSGPETEFRARAKLLGGRGYRLKIEAVKIDKAGKNKKDFVGPPAPESPPAAVLRWAVPGGRPLELVPDRFLSEAKVSEVYVSPVSFPPDDRSLGWERGNFVSKAWDQATTDAAVAAADHVTARLDELTGTKPDAKDRGDKLKAFVTTFVGRAFRRPLDDKQKSLYVEGPFKREADPAQAVRRAVLLALKSPRFLYREVGEPTPQHDTAARLAFALWDGLPDKQLREAADKGKLGTPEQIRKQAERMRADPRFALKLEGFLRHWLQVDHVGELAKDPKKFPGFDAATAADLRASLDRTLADAATSGDFRKLVLGDELYLNGRLAKLYGADLPADAAWQRVKLDPGQRVGVLTHPFVLATFAYPGASSPIHRGVFLARGVMGRVLMPPQEAFSPLAEDLHPTLSTRERVTLQTRGANCQGCHTVINPLGFTLEGFDGIGKLRELDRGKPVEITGAYTDRAGAGRTFTGPAELAAFVADSPEVHGAVAEGVFHHFVGQPVRAFGADAADKLRESFAAAKYDLRVLAVEAAVLGAMPPVAVAAR